MKCSVEKPFQGFVSHIQRNNLTYFKPDRLGAKNGLIGTPSFIESYKTLIFSI